MQGILGLGSYLPAITRSNQAIVQSGVDTTDAWIQTRTGIKSRHIASNTDTTSSMALAAGKQALDKAGVRPDQLGAILVATSTPDYPGFPAVATQVQAGLGPIACPAWDISAACAGFVVALDCASRYDAPVLIIASDTLSRRVDWADRRTCILFGDGAGAAVIGPVATGGIQTTLLQSHGAYADLLVISPASGHIHMNGQAVFKLAVQCIMSGVTQALEQIGLHIDQISWFVPHQANSRITQYAADKLGIPESKQVQTIQDHGNTSAASIPIALAAYDTQFKPGDYVLLAGFGAGFTWGVSVIVWS